MRICRPGQVLIKIGIGAAALSFAMNIIRRYKVRRRLADQVSQQKNEVRKALSLIPNSHLAGISVLPVEIWAVIIEHVVTQELGTLNSQCWDLPSILQYRYVCREYGTYINHFIPLINSRTLQERS